MTGVLIVITLILMIRNATPFTLETVSSNDPATQGSIRTLERNFRRSWLRMEQHVHFNAHLECWEWLGRHLDSDARGGGRGSGFTSKQAAERDAIEYAERAY